MTWPEELGGRGLTHVDTALVEDVFGYHWLPLSLYLLSYKTIGSALERFASPALKERLLGPIARGELTFCQGFSEPEAGSDLASLTTRAVRRDDRWIVDGHKIWTSSAWLADWIYLAVRTNPDEPRHRGISVLVAPLDTPGNRGAPLSRARWRLPVRGVPRRRRDPRGEPRRRRRSRLGRAHAHARLRADHGREARRAGLDPGRARGAAA